MTGASCTAIFVSTSYKGSNDFQVNRGESAEQFVGRELNQRASDRQLAHYAVDF